MASHCYINFAAASQMTMGGMLCCFISTAASAQEFIVLASNVVSHLMVTMEASDSAEKERSGNWKMLTVLFAQSVSSVKKWIPSKRTTTGCVTRGGLHLSAIALSLHNISKAGRAFSFVSGARVY